MGATVFLNCLNRFTGERHWMRRTLEENDAKINNWGMSGSPLVHGNLVIVLVGGEAERSMVAYETQSGEPVWHGGHDGAGYSSPLHAVLAGTPQILALNRGSVVAHDPQTGKLLWEQPWPQEHPNVAQPLPLPGNRVLVSSSYGDGCALFQVKRTAEGGLTSEQIWKTRALNAKFANFVHRDGFVYGLDEGILVCLDVATGKRRWKQGRYGHGQMILVEDLLIVTAEAGEVLLLEVTPREHKVVGRFQAFEDKTWNSPALAAPYLLVRNHREAACYELPLAESVNR
jgi:outer membrane protein assembly factor BamB